MWERKIRVLIFLSHIFLFYIPEFFLPRFDLSSSCGVMPSEKRMNGYYQAFIRKLSFS